MQQVQEVFRSVFDDDSVVLTAETSAADVEGWDSMMHLNLIIALEKRFAIKFSTAEISGLKDSGQNVSTLLRLIASKKGART
ncbi:MAG TPA: acyl carrier protein [Anaerolineales bacterium]